MHTFLRPVRVRRILGATTLGLAVALSASACGDDSATDNSGHSEHTTGDHNDADVAFATDMIQHHAQALSMVDLTVGRTLDPEVAALTEAIRTAQTPEIETMTDWLTDWGEDVPATMRDHVNAGHGDEHGDEHSGETQDPMAGMEGMDTDMPGMMSAEQMTELANASDEDFQQLWLEMMIEHHEGALEMAETEVADGAYADAVTLAQAIIDSQTAEIEQMQALVGP